MAPVTERITATSPGQTSAPAKESAPIVEPDANVAPSLDGEHYVYVPTSHEFPSDQGLQSEQVFDSVK